MYDPNRCDYISLAMYHPENAFPEAVMLLAESAGSEREDELFYDYLSSVAPQEDREIIASIRDDERKHNRLFRQIYCQITGGRAVPEIEEEFERPASYCAGLKQALFGELAAVEKYRKILFGLSYCQVYANVLTEIYTDELKHAAKWNYLYCQNGCCGSKL